MSQAQFTLSWDSYQQNICRGLGALQQNEDFVDMTIAADGHMVKVHQLVLSLASPYIKALIQSAQCQNPVIFLNKISSHTLSSILEYIYTGQVIVAKENIEELVQAAKALHIKGLMDMSYQVTLSDTSRSMGNMSSLQKQSGHHETHQTQIYSHNTPLDEPTDYGDDTMNDPCDSETDTENLVSEGKNKGIQDVAVIQSAVLNSNTTKPTPENIQFQYTVSNKGNLQMVLNRFVYFLRYTGKSGHRQWRCTDYIKKKCPASVTTKDNIVLRRTQAHIHPFHDKKITKKIKSNSIFSVISEAEKQGDCMKKGNE